MVPRDSNLRTSVKRSTRVCRNIVSCMTRSLTGARLSVLEKCSALAATRQSAGTGRGVRPLCVVRVGPRDAIDREPRRDRDGRGRHSGKGHDVSMEVRLVDVSALSCDCCRAVTGGETMGHVVETNQLCGALRSEADLGPKARPQTLAAPSDLAGEPLDPNVSAAGHQLVPRERDLPVDRST